MALLKNLDKIVKNKQLTAPNKLLLKTYMRV
jgi:hypothetical protein